MSRKKADSKPLLNIWGFELKDRELPTDQGGGVLNRIAVATRRHCGGPGSDRALPHLDPQLWIHRKPF